MPLLRFIDSTWGDLQVITPAPLGTVHEPCIEVVMPVPTVVLTTWRLTVIDNPAALAINLLGVFRFEAGCGRGRIEENVPVAVGTPGDQRQMPLQSLRAYWITGTAAGAELATVQVTIMTAPLTPPGPSYNNARAWMLPADQVEPPGITANYYSGGNIDPWNPLQPVYPGGGPWDDE